MASSPSMFGDGPAAQADSPLGDYIQPNLGHGLRIWWAFCWRNTIIAGILDFTLGIVAQLAYVRGGISPGTRNALLQFGPYPMNYLPALFVMHFIIRKNFRDFRIRLISVRDSDFTVVVQPTFRRTFRIWWTYTWRTLAYVAILTVAMWVPLGFVTGAVAVVFPALSGAFTLLIGSVVGGAVGLYVIYANILDEDFADFRVTLAPKQTAATAPGATATATS
jgi:hypothetical protein